ncbi:MAG TPA: NAD(P)-binding domain-containing protein [Devosia sp.]|nr:NAD(P)-binding domain-containing protein [Devosia sp.]
MRSIGVIGIGTIGGALVEGLQGRGAAPPTLVSARSEGPSAALAARYPNVTRAASNAEVATADIVVLAMRPAQLQEALAGVEFRPGQLVLSLVAGLGLGELQQLAPRSRVDRAVPMPGMARGEGPITLYPGLPETRELLAPLGDLFAVPEEAMLNMGGLTAFLSSYFELQQALIARAEAAGIPRQDARRYVVSMLGMLAGTARLTPPGEFDGLVPGHQTKGGLNERVHAALLAAGWFERPAAELEAITRLGWKNLG